MKNRIIFLLGLISLTIVFSLLISSYRNIPDFQSYDGLLFFDIEEQQYFLEDIESGTDVLLEFKYEDTNRFELDGITHVEVYGLFNKNKNCLRVLSLIETDNNFDLLP